MLKKKLIIGLSALSGTIILSSIVGSQYIINSHSHDYNYYRVLPQSASTTDLIQAYFAATVKGAKLEYLASYAHTTPLTIGLNYSKKYNSTLFNNLGKTGYVLIDDQYGSPLFNSDGIFDTKAIQPLWSTNVASVQFRADLGSFITGIASAQFLNDYRESFLKNDNKLTWATYGAFDLPSVVSFMGGFQQGINWFNENIAKNSNEYLPIENAGDNLKPFGKTFDPYGNTEIISQYINPNSEIDLFFPVAGAQISNVIKHIIDFRKKMVVISTDSPAELNTSINKTIPNLHDNEQIGYKNQIIQFSSVKNTDEIVSKITHVINNPQKLIENQNNPEWSNIGGIGYNSLGNVANGGVGVSNEGKSYFIKAMKTYASKINYPQKINNYIDATKFLENQVEFKNLDLPNYKKFTNKTLSKPYWYSSIVNNGNEMLPISSTINDIKQWYLNMYQNDTNLKKNIDKNLKYIEDWINKYQSAIEIRKNTAKNLINQFNANAYNKNKGLITIVFQDPVSVLFDNGYLQSCYGALIKYWGSKDHDIQLPAPPNSN